MSGDGAPATVVPWPGNYDVADVPPAEFTPGAAAEDPPYNMVASEGGEALALYYADGKALTTKDRWGNDVAESTYYDSTGRRKQFYWADGTPASSYWPDGTQIPFYSRNDWPGQITNDVDDPLWTPPPVDDPEDPEDPEDPGAPAGALVTVAELQAFMPDDDPDDDLCTLAVEAATAVVAAYCRGRHLDTADRPRPGVKMVVLTAAARIAANPSGISRQDTAGSFSTRRSGGFTGLTLAELTVLKRYRKQAIGP